MISCRLLLQICILMNSCPAGMDRMAWHTSSLRWGMRMILWASDKRRHAGMGWVHVIHALRRAMWWWIERSLRWWYPTRMRLVLWVRWVTRRRPRMCWISMLQMALSLMIRCRLMLVPVRLVAGTSTRNVSWMGSFGLLFVY
jgi:hypothetical protein